MCSLVGQTLASFSFLCYYYGYHFSLCLFQVIIVAYIIAVKCIGVASGSKQKLTVYIAQRNACDHDIPLLFIFSSPSSNLSFSFLFSPFLIHVGIIWIYVVSHVCPAAGRSVHLVLQKR